ncbi:MAG: 4'-phosphopantetheinyl transferase superfamily protein, partial [Bifidobacteriaceae bacterium]|jgi:4'-phosphopantetheinyl transferase|nr:4'-phosphopantetheinyl transferase superfamily protein [Bifidobacteriaceae bacterium]
MGLSYDERDMVRQLPENQRDHWRTRTWVRKQAVLKATGHALTVDPSLLDVAGGVVREFPMQLAQDLANGVQIVDLPRVPAGYCAAIAYLGAAPPLVVAGGPIPGLAVM